MQDSYEYIPVGANTLALETGSELATERTDSHSGIISCLFIGSLFNKVSGRKESGRKY